MCVYRIVYYILRYKKNNLKIKLHYDFSYFTLFFIYLITFLKLCLIYVRKECKKHFFHLGLNNIKKGK